MYPQVTVELQEAFNLWRVNHSRGTQAGGRKALQSDLGLTRSVAQEILRLERENSGKGQPVKASFGNAQSEVVTEPIITGAKPNDFVITPEAAWNKLEIANEKSKAFEALRSNQQIEFPNEPMGLVILSDQHIGGSGADTQRMKYDAQVVANTPNMHAVLTGDAINNFIVSKLNHARAMDALRVDEQWQALKHYLGFFLDSNGKSKIVASLSGNHEQWTTKIAGFDMLRGLMPEHVLYDTDEINTKIKVGGFDSSWLFRHKTRYNSLYNVLHGAKQTVRMNNSDAPDVIVAAHIHRGAVYEQFYHNGQKKLGLLTGTYKVTDPYSRESGFGGGGKGNCLTVVITPDGQMQPFDDVKLAADFLEFQRMRSRLTK